MYLKSQGDSMAKSPDGDCHLNANVAQAIKVARQGEHDALGVLLDFYRGYLLSKAANKLSRDIVQKVAPSDLVQETLMQASRSFGEFQGSTEAELRAWLRKILERKVIDTHRHYRNFERRDVSREVPLMEQVWQTVPWKGAVGRSSSRSAGSEKFDVLAIKFAQLNDEQKKAIQLRTFDRLSFEEVGKQLGRSTEAARKIWTRAIQKIAQELRSYENRAESDNTAAAGFL
jgi:RNA polymerase sigma-70 factor, ECF subfamily